MSRQPAAVGGAARDQPAHAVAEDDDPRERGRPGFRQRFERFGELPPVLRHVQAAVVVQIDGGPAKVARKRGGVVVPGPRPREVAHAQAVYRDDQGGGCAGDLRGQHAAYRVERDTVLPESHVDRKRIRGPRQVIADEAVQRGDERVARGRVGDVADQRREPSQRGIQAATHCVGDAANRPIHAAGDRIDGPSGRAAPTDRHLSDTPMQCLDQFRDGDRRFDGEARGAADVLKGIARPRLHRCASRRAQIEVRARLSGALTQGHRSTCTERRV